MAGVFQVVLRKPLRARSCRRAPKRRAEGEGGVEAEAAARTVQDRTANAAGARTRATVPTTAAAVAPQRPGGGVGGVEAQAPAQAQAFQAGSAAAPNTGRRRNSSPWRT